MKRNENIASERGNINANSFRNNIVYKLASTLQQCRLHSLIVIMIVKRKEHSSGIWHIK